MKALERFEISFNKPTQIYSSGDSVEGKLTIKLTESLPITSKSFCYYSLFSFLLNSRIWVFIAYFL